MIPTGSLPRGAMHSGMILVVRDVYIIAMRSVAPPSRRDINSSDANAVVKGLGESGDTSLHSCIAYCSLRKQNKETSGRAFVVRWPDDS